jgi:hypothetical protein
MEQKADDATVELPVYRFQMRGVSRPEDAYYQTRWDKAVSMSVLAGTQKEADQKAFAMLGDLKGGNYWALKTDRIDEEA